MHLMIGLMFGPLIWFSFLMMGLLIGCFAPAIWLERLKNCRKKPDSS